MQNLSEKTVSSNVPMGLLLVKPVRGFFTNFIEQQWFFFFFLLLIVSKTWPVASYTVDDNRY